MKKSRFGAALASAAMLSVGSLAMAETVPFGQTEDFESYNVGDTPPTITPAYAVHGGATVAGDSTNKYAVLTPGADDSRKAGFREGPFGAIGRQAAFPGYGDTYSIFTDIYTESAAGVSGTLSWINMIYKNTGGYLDENSFVLTPGETNWNAKFTSGPGAIDLAADKWYTFEMVWDRSAGDNYTVTGNIYDQLSGSVLFSSTMTQNTFSADLGGPMTSWFTNWGNDTVNSLMIDNIGTSAVVPTPGAAAAGMFLIGVLGLKRRRPLN